jgi:hypothetical protein
VTPSPPALVGASCVQNPDCSTNAWCNDDTYVEWCPRHSTSQCPTPHCLVKDTSDPEPEPETEPVTPAPATPAPTPAPTPDPPASSVTCKATQGLNRGVTDVHCAKCATGYKWWPCNEAILCECSGALVQSGARLAKATKHSFLARDQGMLQMTREHVEL